MINLPFMNNAKVTLNNHAEPHLKKDLDKIDTGHNFEHVIQSEESSSTNEGLVKSSAQNDTQANNDQQTKGDESDVTQTQDSSGDSESDPATSVELDNQAGLNDVSVVSLNQVLSELTISLSQTIEIQKDNNQTDDEGSFLDISTQEEVKNTVNDISLIDLQTTQVATEKVQTNQSDESGSVDLNLANLSLETSQVATQNSGVIKDDEDQSIQVGDASQDDETATQITDDDHTSSNNDNAINLKNFNYWQANGVQESLNLKSDFEKKNHDHVVALASKSLLEGMNPLALQKSQIESKLQAVDLKLQNISARQMNDMVDAKSVINQLYDGVKTGIKQDAQQIQINLDPPEWGAIQVRMNIVKNDVNLSVVTENQAVKEALEKGVNALRGQFMQNGLNLANVNIGVGGGGAEQAEKEARERLADDERNQVKRLLKTPAGAAHGINLITTTTGVIDSHV